MSSPALLKIFLAAALASACYAQADQTRVAAKGKLASRPVKCKPYVDVFLCTDCPEGQAFQLCTATGTYDVPGKAAASGVPYSGATGDVDLGAHVVRAAGFEPTGTDPSKLSFLQGACPAAATAGYDYTICFESDKAYKVSAAGVKTLIVSATDAGAELVANKGAADGYAPLDSSSRIPSANLPLGMGFDPTVVAVAEDFNCGHGGGSGDHTSNCIPWNMYGTGATFDAQPSAFPHVGIQRLAISNTAASNYATAAFTNYNMDVSVGSVSNLLSTADWEMHWIFRLNQTTNVKFDIGFAHSFNTTFLFGLRFDTSKSDAGFVLHTYADTTAAVAAADTNWHHLVLTRVDASTLAATLDGVRKTACETGCDATVKWSDYNGWGVGVMAYVSADTAGAANTLDLDYFGMKIPVGSR